MSIKEKIVLLLNEANMFPIKYKTKDMFDIDLEKIRKNKKYNGSYKTEIDDIKKIYSIIFNNKKLMNDASRMLRGDK